MKINKDIRIAIVVCYIFVMFIPPQLVFAHHELKDGGEAPGYPPPRDDDGCVGGCCDRCCDAPPCEPCQDIDTACCPEDDHSPTGPGPGPEPSSASGFPVSGDPVFINNGEYLLHATDLTLPGRSQTIKIERTYRSRSQYNGSFGYGWDMNYNLRLRRLKDPNTVILLDGQCNRMEYTRNDTDPNLYENLKVHKGYCYYDDVNDTFALIKTSGVEYKFDIHGNLVAILDESGNQLTFTYDPNGLMPLTGKSGYFLPEEFGGPSNGRGLVAMMYRLIKITDDLGREVSLSYNDQGLLEEITDFAGRTWQYTYDPYTNDLLGITTPGTNEYPSGLTVTYIYDDDDPNNWHNLEYVYDANDDLMVRNYYDNEDRVYQQDVGDGSYEFYHDPGDSTTTIIDREGYEIDMVYNEAGQLISQTVYTKNPQAEPNSSTITYHYDPDYGRRTLRIYPGGNCVAYTYDNLGRIIGKFFKASPSEPNDIDDPNVIAELYTYDTNFPYKIKTITDPMGNVTTYDYNSLTGNLDKITFPAITTDQGQQTPIQTYTYNEFGQIETITVPDGMVTKYYYYDDSDTNDPNAGRLWKIVEDYNETGGLNITTEYKYGAYGDIVEVIDPNGNSRHSYYNELSQLAKIMDPLGNVTLFGYDKVGNQNRIEREITNEPNQVITFDYNIQNKFYKKTDPLGYSTIYSYNKNSEPNMVTDAEDNNTKYEYNERGSLIKITDANNGITVFNYNENRHLADINDPNGNITNYSYDGFDRLTMITYPDDSNEQFTYDKNGNITSKRNRAGDTIYYEYDAMNHMAVKNRPFDPNIYFTSDISGRVVEVNDLRSVSNGGSITSFKYDSIGRVEEVNDIENRIVKYEYDDRGLRTKLTYPDNVNVTYEYNSVSRLKVIKYNGDIIAEYEYDELNRRMLMTYGSDANAVYEYDLGNRLTKLTNNIDDSNTIAFEYASYDKVGNRLSMKIDDSNTHIYEYDKLYQLTYVDYNDGNSTSYDYDVLGNRMSVDDGTETNYYHNRLNQYYRVDTTSYSYDKNGNLTNDGQYKYYYDSENRLIDVNDQSNNPVASYKYDYLGRRVKKVVYGSPDVITKYCYDGDQVIAEYDQNDTLLRKFVYGDGIDEPIAMYVTGNGWYYYHYNGLGSVVALSDSSANIIEKYTYDVFGQVTIKDSSEQILTISCIGNPYFFTGRRLDNESKLYYYRARYYNPTLGRFLQTDPLKYTDVLNLYTYVGNNPINGRDPFGLMSCEECQTRYDNARQKILEAASECHNECNPSSIGPAVALCLMSCAKTGAYFPLCLLGCGAATQIPWAVCHYACSRMANENEKNVRFAYKLCMDNCGCKE